MLIIAPLHEYPDYAPVLAFWAYQEWYRERSLAFDIILKAYIDRIKDDALPQSFVAIRDSVPAGMATLKLNDLWSRPEINPWLSSLYVVPEFRNNGIGHDLTRAIIDRAGELGFESLHLFLGQRDPGRLERYYTKRGWSIADASMDNDGRPTKILRHATSYCI